MSMATLLVEQDCVKILFDQKVSGTATVVDQIELDIQRLKSAIKHIEDEYERRGSGRRG